MQVATSSGQDEVCSVIFYAVRAAARSDAPPVNASASRRRDDEATAQESPRDRNAHASLVAMREAALLEKTRSTGGGSTQSLPICMLAKTRNSLLPCALGSPIGQLCP